MITDLGSVSALLGFIFLQEDAYISGKTMQSLHKCQLILLILLVEEMQSSTKTVRNVSVTKTMCLILMVNA